MMSFNGCNCRELLTYTDSNKPLVETDLDKIGKSKRTNVHAVGASNGQKETTAFDCIRQVESSDDGVKVETDYDENASKEVILPHDESVPDSSSKDSHTALKLTFTLPSSCYATMAIRELLKTSTSVSTYVEKAFYCYSVFQINHDCHKLLLLVNFSSQTGFALFGNTVMWCQTHVLSLLQYVASL